VGGGGEVGERCARQGSIGVSHNSPHFAHLDFTVLTCSKAYQNLKPKTIKRMAAPHEIRMLMDKEGDDAKAKRACQQKVYQHHLDMESFQGLAEAHLLLLRRPLRELQRPRQ